MPFVHCDGARIWWRADGRPDAPALVMLNSLGSDHAVWEPVMRGLARHFRVIRLDARGHGASDAPAGDYTLERLGRDVLAVADAAGAQRFHLLGLSLGGMTAMWIAGTHPARIDRLVLTNTSATSEPKGIGERIAAVRAQGMPAVADAVLARWFTPRFTSRRTGHQASVRETLLSIDPVGYAGCCAAIRDMALTPLLPRITAPTLVITGRFDASTPPEQGRRIAQTIPRAHCLELPTAHFSHSEQPGRFVDWVVRFLQGCDDPSDRAARRRPEQQRFDEGLARRRSVMGAAQVDERLADAGPIGAGLEELATRCAWGDAWEGPALDERTRRLIAIAQSLALGQWEAFRTLVARGLDAELDVAELEELVLQSALQCGLPAADAAARHADEVLRAHPGPLG